MIGNHTINAVTLTGTATWGAGSTDTGTVTLKAIGTGKSRMDLTLTDGTRTEIRDASAGNARGKWISPDGTSGMFAAHNTQTDPVWFFPLLGSLSGGMQTVLSYIGKENRDGHLVEHLRSMASHAASAAGTDSTPKKLSAMDFYLDAETHLPVALEFYLHPDNDSSTNILIEIDYSDYQVISGVQVPMCIQRSANGAPVVDISVTSATFNAGVALSDFSINE